MVRILGFQCCGQGFNLVGEQRSQLCKRSLVGEQRSCKCKLEQIRVSPENLLGRYCLNLD